MDGSPQCGCVSTLPPYGTSMPQSGCRPPHQKRKGSDRVQDLAMRTAVAHAGSMTTDSASTQHAVDTLRAALDEIELGTVLLDSDLHVQFVNSAFLRIYHLPDKSVVSGLDFEGLMRRVVG